MSILVEAQQEVNNRVNEKHDEIIREFLERISQPSSCECGFHLRAKDFALYLRAYVNCKINIHHFRQRGEDYFNNIKFFVPDVHYIRNMRMKLIELAPCSSCIVKYNPTNRRQKSPWNPKRARALKELFQ